MRITKALLRDARSKLIESQARLCAILAAGGRDGLWAEHQLRYPHYVGGCPERTEELLRQLLYGDVMRIIPDLWVD